jgi:restriction endonuclease Mrr
MASKDDVPTFDQLFNPTLSALRNLGGSGSNQEVVDEIARLLDLPEDVVDIDHGRGGYTELGYRAAWARTYLKNFGLILNSERGVWAITSAGAKIEKVDPRRVVRDFRGAMIGRADKGLIITTGGFTREARREATRDGAPPIDLIDGELLTEKLKELRLGISVEQVETVSVDRDWFESL